MLEAELAQLAAITEGAGPVVHIIVTPSCDKAREMWSASRATAARLTYRWIPFAFGVADDTLRVARAFDARNAEAVRSMMIGAEDETHMPSSEAISLTQLQDMAYEEKVARLLWESTGKTPATPTMVFTVPGGGIRVVRGAIGADRFEQMAGMLGV